MDDHVASGSGRGYASQFISTCRSYSAVTRLVDLKCKFDTKNVRIVKIDLDQIYSYRVTNLSDSGVRERYLRNKIAKGYAERFEEVFITGTIPNSAFEEIYSGEGWLCPSSEP